MTVLYSNVGSLTPDDVTPCPRCGRPLGWLRDGETVRGQGQDRMHGGCYDGEVYA